MTTTPPRRRSTPRSSAGAATRRRILHYEARSLAREDRDEEALKVYRQVVLRYPRSAFAEKSAYLAARIDLQAGRFEEAAQEYTRYLATYRKGEHRDEAVYERALTWLSAGNNVAPGVDQPQNGKARLASAASGAKAHAAQAWKELLGARGEGARRPRRAPARASGRRLVPHGGSRGGGGGVDRSRRSTSR